MNTSEEYIKVTIVHPTVHFFFLLYINIASYLYGKQIKSKMGNKLYLQMIFICVRLNWLGIHKCHTMPLNDMDHMLVLGTEPSRVFLSQ